MTSHDPVGGAVPTGRPPTSPGRATTLAVDTAAAAAFALVSLAMSFGALSLTDPRVGPVAATVWSITLCLPLAVRRVWPVAAAGLVAVVAVSHVLLGPALVFPADLAVLVALASVTVHGPRWAGQAALGTALAGSSGLAVALAADAGNPLEIGLPVFVLAATSALATWALALLRRARLARQAALLERTERLEHEHAQALRLATQTERARIAREMHDIVAHSLSVMVAQADGGRYAAAAEPAAATRALETIGETGRAALADMRQLLGVLRTDDGDSPGPGHTSSPAPPGPAALEPQPVSGNLESLVEQVRASGPEISVVRVGTERALPPGVALTMHRICQEALTNVLKHAGPDVSVTVLLRWSDAAVTLEVSDDGRGASAVDEGGGHGIVGMRERTAMLGGSFSAGPRPGGGYRVRVQLPLPKGGAADAAAGADDLTVAEQHGGAP